MKHQYPLSEFLADVMTVEDLKREWSSDTPFHRHIARYFREAHGDSEETEWRYVKYMIVNVYVSSHMTSFDSGSLAVAGADKALVRGQLFSPILEYAVRHDLSDVEEFPDPSYFHPK